MRYFTLTLLTITNLLFLTQTNLIPPPVYQTFNQCNPQWGNQAMGQDGATVCKKGSLMTCISIGLSSHNFKLPQGPSNPGTLNQ